MCERAATTKNEEDGTNNTKVEVQFYYEGIEDFRFFVVSGRLMRSTSSTRTSSIFQKLCGRGFADFKGGAFEFGSVEIKSSLPKIESFRSPANTVIEARSDE